MSVAVVIPCYNQAHLLRDAVDSVLRQSCPADEIVVVDDGSDDETHRVCREYRDEILYVRQENRGLSGARNSGVRLAQSEFVHFLDADDMLRPMALAYLLETAALHPDASVFTASWEEIDSRGSVTASVAAPELGSDPYHALFDALAVGPPCRYLVRRVAVLEAGFFDQRLRSCEDWDLWLRIANLGRRFVTCPEAVAVYRKLPGSMSQNHARMWRSGVSVLRRARDRHSCDECRLAYRDGIEAWRRYCYLSILRAHLRQDFDSGHIGQGLIECARAVYGDPPVARLLAGSLIRNLSLGHVPAIVG